LFGEQKLRRLREIGVEANEENPYELFDDRFGECQAGDRQLQRRFSEGRWLEGPAYFPAARYLVWSDVPNNQILRWDEMSGRTGIFRRDTNYANGNTVDFHGRLVTCEHGARRVTRTDHDGSITMISERYEGKPSVVRMMLSFTLTAPSGLQIRPMGSIVTIRGTSREAKLAHRTSIEWIQ
jgi:hypothetical protein